MRFGMKTVLLACWLLPIGMVAAAPKPPSKAEIDRAKAFLKEVVSPTPLPKAQREKVVTLLAQLGAEAWSVRARATKDLIRVGPRAEHLVRPASKSPNLEIKSRVEEILAAYMDAQAGRAGRVAEAADLLARAKAPAGIDALIALIDHGDSDIRHSVEYALRRLTGQRFGFNAHDPADQRAAPAGKWRAWWKTSRDEFDFTPALARMRVQGVLACDYMKREVFIVDLNGKKTWSKKLSQRPYCAAPAPNGNVLVVLYDDKGESTIEEYNRQGKKVWNADKLALRRLQDVARLSNGNTLTTDPMGRRVIEVVPKTQKIVWQYNTGNTDMKAIQGLPNGNTLVCLYAGQVQEISRGGKVVWELAGLSSPLDAQKLPNGNVLITEYGRRRIVELTVSGKEVWQWSPSNAVRRPFSARRLPDGRTVVQVRGQGIVLVDSGGKVVRELTKNVPRCFEKIRLVYTPVPTKPPPRRPS